VPELCSADLNKFGMSAAAGTVETAGFSSWRTYGPVISAARDVLRTPVTAVWMTAASVE
jgi:hypothetical protein